MSIPAMQLVAQRDLDATQAQAITNRIRSKMGDLMSEIAKAHMGRAWIALGYATWTDYVKGEFDYAPLSLPREERRAVTHLLRKQGMSTRAIAAVEGVDKDTVRRDLLSGGVNTPPELEPLDVEFDEDELAEELIAAEPIHGLDGKSYQPTKPRPVAAEKSHTEKVTTACPTCGGTGVITREV
jgi:hypothetical protein